MAHANRNSKVHNDQNEGMMEPQQSAQTSEQGHVGDSSSSSLHALHNSTATASERPGMGHGRTSHALQKRFLYVIHYAMARWRCYHSEPSNLATFLTKPLLNLQDDLFHTFSEHDSSLPAAAERENELSLSFEEATKRLCAHFSKLYELMQNDAVADWETPTSSHVEAKLPAPSPVFRNHVSRTMILAARDFLYHKEQHYTAQADSCTESLSTETFRATLLRTVWELVVVIADMLLINSEPAINDASRLLRCLTLLLHCMLVLRQKWDKQDRNAAANDGKTDSNRNTRLLRDLNIDSSDYIDRVCHQYKFEEVEKLTAPDKMEKIRTDVALMGLLVDAYKIEEDLSAGRLLFFVYVVRNGDFDVSGYFIRKICGLDKVPLHVATHQILHSDENVQTSKELAEAFEDVKLVKPSTHAAEEQNLQTLIHEGLKKITLPKTIQGCKEHKVEFPFGSFSAAPTIPAIEAARVAMMSFFAADSPVTNTERRQPSTTTTLKNDEREHEQQKKCERLESIGKIVGAYREKMCSLVLQNMPTDDSSPNVFPQAQIETCKKRILIGDSRIADAVGLKETDGSPQLISRENSADAKEFCKTLLAYVASGERNLLNSVRSLVELERLDLAIKMAGTDLRLQKSLVDVLVTRDRIEKARMLAGEFELARRIGSLSSILKALDGIQVDASDVMYSPHWFDKQERYKEGTEFFHLTATSGADLSSRLRVCCNVLDNKYFNVPMIFYESLAEYMMNCSWESNPTEPLQTTGQPRNTIPVAYVSTYKDLDFLRRYLERRVCTDNRDFVLPIVGIDVEWRPQKMYDAKTPSYDMLNHAETWQLPHDHIESLETEYSRLFEGRANKPIEWPASVLQLATNELTILVDLLALEFISLKDEQDSGTESSLRIDACIDYVFGDLLMRKSSIFVVGQGVEGDLAKLCSTHPRWKTAFESCTSLVDLRILLQSEHNDISTWSSSHQRSLSLSKLVENTFSMQLSKEQQTSDWQIRPLSAEQKRYAATDAFVAVALTLAVLQEQDSSVALEKLQCASRRYSAASCTDFELPSYDFSGGLMYTPRYDVSSLKKYQNVMTVRSVLTRCQNSTNLGVRIAQHASGRSAAQTASFIGVQLGRIIKTLAFTCSDNNIVAVVRGDRYIDTKKLARSSGFSAGKIRLASLEHCSKIYGYEPGEFPPVGFPKGITIVLDTSIRDFDFVYGGGGTVEHMLITDLQELQEANHFDANGDYCPKDATNPRVIVDNICKDSLTPASCRNPKAVVQAQAMADTKSTEHNFWTPPKFIVDSMLGRLVRWLRVIGVNCLHTDRNTPREQMVQNAIDSDRILLTRDSKLAARKGAYLAFFVEGNDTAEQFRHVTEHFGIVCSPSSLMSRCAKCNGEGYYRLDREVVKERYSHIVHQKVLNTVEEYWECRHCGQLYWEGPKFYDTREKFEAILHEYEKTF